MKNSILFVLLIFFTSCVPYKNIVYVQGQPENQQDEKVYKVKKKDILYINIKSSNDEINKIYGVSDANSGSMISPQKLYFTGYTVDDKGEIELPVIGKIFVEEKTFSQIQQIIKKKLLQSQLVTLGDVFILVKLAGIPYTVVGEVKRPQNGILYKTNPNIFDVLADAGDISLTGDRKNVFVIRKEDGKQVKKSLDLTDAKIINSKYYHIRPNDLIYVQPLRQKTLGTGTTLSQTISTTISALSLVTSIILFTNFINNK